MCKINTDNKKWRQLKLIIGWNLVEAKNSAIYAT